MKKHEEAQLQAEIERVCNAESMRDRGITPARAWQIAIEAMQEKRDRLPDRERGEIERAIRFFRLSS